MQKHPQQHPEARQPPDGPRWEVSAEPHWHIPGGCSAAWSSATGQRGMKAQGLGDIFIVVVGEDPL